MFVKNVINFLQFIFLFQLAKKIENFYNKVKKRQIIVFKFEKKNKNPNYLLLKVINEPEKD